MWLARQVADAFSEQFNGRGVEGISPTFFITIAQIHLQFGEVKSKIPQGYQSLAESCVIELSGEILR